MNWPKEDELILTSAQVPFFLLTNYQIFLTASKHLFLPQYIYLRSNMGDKTNEKFNQ